MSYEKELSADDIKSGFLVNNHIEQYGTCNALFLLFIYFIEFSVFCIFYLNNCGVWVFVLCVSNISSL